MNNLILYGSLYLLAVTNVKWLGAITPIGELSFLVGWACAGGLTVVLYAITRM